MPNIVDILIVVGIIGYVIAHIEEGFVILAGRLISFFGGLVLAFLTYEFLSGTLAGIVDLPPGMLDALSFILLFLLIQALLRYVIMEIYYLVPFDIHSSFASKILAIVPALIDGLVITALVLLILVIIPVFPGVKEPIEESRFGSRLVNKVSQAEVYIDRVFGRATQETLGFLTIRPDDGEFLELPYTVDELSVDEAAERRMLELVNAERAKVGAGPLIMDPDLVPVARAHSEDMWRRGYFAHENPDGETPFDRMRESAVQFRAAGENLALARTVERAHQGLMNSPGHKRNILDPAFTRVGIGVISGGIYGKMFTQNFAD